MTEKGQFRPVVVSCKVRLLGASPDTTPVRTTGLLTAGRNPGGRNGPDLTPDNRSGINVRIPDKTGVRSRECIHVIDRNYHTDNITGRPGGRAKREKLRQ